MELKDFKKRFIQKREGMNIRFTKEERTFLYGKYYELTGKTANISCSSCDSFTFKILLNHLNIQEANKPKEKVKKNKTKKNASNKNI